MAQPTDSSTILSVAQEIFGQTYLLDRHLRQNSIAQPSLAVGAHSDLWSSTSEEVSAARNSIFDLTNQLSKLINGPHGFLHDYISPNWELGALYTVLEFDILEKIPLDGEVHVSELAAQSGLPEDKLLRVLRLTSCEDILKEVSNGVFRHTAISEELVNDKKFKAFIGFQSVAPPKDPENPYHPNLDRLFETRVASAHLADSLKKKNNDFRNGQSAFRHAWGSPMYDWHKSHPEKGARFEQAMQGVTQSLDPGNDLFRDWFQQNQQNDRRLVVDVCGKNGMTSTFLAGKFPELSFEVQDASQALLKSGESALEPGLEQRIKFSQREMFSPQALEHADQVLAYTIRNVMWNLSDEECIKLLSSFIPAMDKSPQTTLLVNEMVSPGKGIFDPYTEKAFRRRDVTVMTMHNAKQRTLEDWKELFAKADSRFKVDYTTAFTSHSYRALWEIRWTA